ncbi:MAG: DUF202 domain-containing protein [Hyphomicrobiales bacterium]|nr:DUF202 domain-containing protein [Hyphomicrobiales bacterium]
MIRNFSDHSANERTFLAWVRTGIAVMAFGFLVAKFNLFLRIAAATMAADGHAVPVPGGGFGGAAGMALIVAGTLIIAVAAWRLVRISRAIDAAEPRGDGEGVDLALAGLLALLGAALVAYLAYTLRTGV